MVLHDFLPLVDLDKFLHFTTPVCSCFAIHSLKFKLLTLYFLRFLLPSICYARFKLSRPSLSCIPENLTLSDCKCFVDYVSLKHQLCSYFISISHLSLSLKSRKISVYTERIFLVTEFLLKAIAKQLNKRIVTWMGVCFFRVNIPVSRTAEKITLTEKYLGC